MNKLIQYSILVDAQSVHHHNDAMQNKLQLIYFDIHGGRGELARMALSIGKISFEDDRIKMADWPARKPSTPFGTLPVLIVNGQPVSQSNGINRYVGKLTGLYPEDPLQALFCDEVMGAVEDITTKLGATFSIKDPEEKRRARTEFADGPLRFYLQQMETVLDRRGGEWFADHRFTVADLKVFLWLKHLRSGVLDHIPVDLVDRVAPKLVGHFERVKSLPTVMAYLTARGLC